MPNNFNYNLNECQLFIKRAQFVVSNLNYLRFNIQNFMGNMIALQWLDKFTMSLEQFFPINLL